MSLSLSKLFIQQLQRELLLNLRQIRICLNTCLFFLMLVVFFPLTLPSDDAQLRVFAPGLVWIAMLLAFFLSAERLFQQDYDDGVLEQWLVSGLPLSVYVSAKLLVHWAVNLLPILIFCPILALLFHLNSSETLVLITSLICGTPAILALCALAAAFATGLRHQGVFMALVLLPLTVPVMIFGSATTLAIMNGLAISGYLALLGAISCLMLAGIPWAIVGVIRISLAE